MKTLLFLIINGKILNFNNSHFKYFYSPPTPGKYLSLTLSSFSFTHLLNAFFVSVLGIQNWVR